MKQEHTKWVKIRCVVNVLSFFGGKSFWVRNVLKSQRTHFTENLLYYVILMSHKGKLLMQGCVCGSNVQDLDIPQKHKLI